MSFQRFRENVYPYNGEGSQIPFRYLCKLLKDQFDDLQKYLMTDIYLALWEGL